MCEVRAPYITACRRKWGRFLNKYCQGCCCNVAHHCQTHNLILFIFPSCSLSLSLYLFTPFCLSFSSCFKGLRGMLFTTTVCVSPSETPQGDTVVLLSFPGQIFFFSRFHRATAVTLLCFFFSCIQRSIYPASVWGLQTLFKRKIYSTLERTGGDINQSHHVHLVQQCLIFESFCFYSVKIRFMRCENRAGCISAPCIFTVFLLTDVSIVLGSNWDRWINGFTPSPLKHPCLMTFLLCDSISID